MMRMMFGFACRTCAFAGWNPQMEIIRYRNSSLVVRIVLVFFVVPQYMTARALPPVLHNFAHVCGKPVTIAIYLRHLHAKSDSRAASRASRRPAQYDGFKECGRTREASPLLNDSETRGAAGKKITCENRWDEADSQKFPSLKINP